MYYLFYLFIIILVLIFIFKEEDFSNTKIKLDLGNFLCGYYHQLLLSILKQVDFNINVFDIINNQIKIRYNYYNFIIEKNDNLLMYDNGDFIQYLPVSIPFENLKSYYLKLSESNITIDRLLQDRYSNELTWRINDSIDEKMHTIMKPLIHSIIDNALTKSDKKINVDTPIIHFRCSDTPFIRYDEYRLQKHCFFTKALEYIQNIKQTEYKNIIILSFINHYSNKDQASACSNYVDSLIKYLENKYCVKIQSKTSLEDFATIFYAPASISTSGSFSFMSGFFGKGVFVSTTQGERCFDCSDQIFKGYNLDHKEAIDYYDTDRIIEQLKICPNI